MKKVLKIIVIILIMLVLLLIINLTRNYIILDKIYDENKNVMSSIDNYHFIYFSKSIIPDTKETSFKDESYYKNGIIFENYWMNSEYYGGTWYNSNTGEKIKIDINGTIKNNTEELDDYEIQIWENHNNWYYLAMLSKKMEMKEIFITYMFKPIMIEDNCYKIKMEDHTYYINRDTKFIEKEIIEENSYITVELEKDVVTDEDVAKPE